MSPGPRTYILWAVVWVLPTVAAQAESDFFRLSPGALSQPHAKFDSNATCTECHELGGGVTNFKCLNCHQHEALRKAIESKHGLHAQFKQSCRTCHTEHKGRSHYIIDWSSLGGRSGFKHGRTGFALQGTHSSVRCTACHKRRLGSGRSSYTGLSAKCESCHGRKHGFTKPALRNNCLQCHPAGRKPRKMTAAQLPFQHGRVTGIAIVGKHATIRCAQCHRGGRMESPRKARTCKSCHRNSHGVTVAKRRCDECHHPSRPWKTTTFDHATTKFPLAGKHAKTPCAKCHKSPKSRPPRTCEGCHEGMHGKRFEGRACTDCHDAGNAKGIIFDHNTKTKFRLEAKHARLKCRQCHRGKNSNQFEKHANTQCGDCHAHKNAHRGQFEGKACTQCHPVGGSKPLAFDHNKNTPFPLLGAHAALGQKKRCGRCHKKGVFRTNKNRCVLCHEDSHKGTLGDKCERCHSPTVKFKKIVFDHATVPHFKRTGKHAEVPCKKCHPERSFKTGKKACVDCHGEKEPHNKKLGPLCERCHVPQPGAPLFDHNTMSKFPITGRHEKVPCAFCHRATFENGPPALGWTKGLTAPKVDKLFPSPGPQCANCHRDNHEGRFGTLCEACHNTSSFKDAVGGGHDRGPFRLEGRHDQLPCVRCHQENVILTGQGDLCDTCHREEDAHRGALGSYCADCHGQRAWRPARFQHAQTGFALRGMHRIARCSGCHGLGTYGGTPTQCDACHLPDALTVIDPLHTAELLDCGRCHGQTGFRPARHFHDSYPLLGRHNFVRCGSCHGTGVYGGTAQSCDGCHLTQYLDPASEPNHMSAGYGTNCEECHTPMAWRPAVRR